MLEYEIDIKIIKLYQVPLILANSKEEAEKIAIELFEPDPDEYFDDMDREVYVHDGREL